MQERIQRELIEASGMLKNSSMSSSSPHNLQDVTMQSTPNLGNKLSEGKAMSMGAGN